jgi:ribonuclease R
MKKSNRQLHTLQSVRDQIVAILTEQSPEQLKTNELSKLIGIRATDQEYDLVREALDELVDEGAIFRGARRKYGIKVPDVTIEGRLENVRAGVWLVVPQDKSEAVMEIDSRDTWNAFHGDIVRAKLVGIPGPGERPRGEVVRVVERRMETVVGTLKQGRQLYVDVDDRKVHKTITIRKNRTDARAGDKVVVRLLEWDDPYEDPEGMIVEKLGRAGEMKAEIRSIAAAYNLPHLFPKDVLQEAESFSRIFSEEDLRGRRDLRGMDIFTIDPYDARDFDDAISIERHDDGDVTLGIHIADVSHYVQEGSALDREAYERGTSVYLVTGVIPMLPERLSNDLCSLRPDEERLAYSVFVRLSPRGAIKDYEITKSVIRSKRRFTYEEALQILESGQGDYADELRAINKMTHVLRENRRKKGSVDFETTELKFVLDEDDRPVEVVQKRPTESTKLIEDCMLLANRVVAEHIGKARGRKSARGGELNPFVYRIHDAPPKEKLLDLAKFVKSLGYNLPVDNIQPKDIQKLVDSVRGTDEQQLITEVTLRSMAKAVYSEFNIGHFGLAFTHYTHFTSPIRRYPDLIVHRMLFEYHNGMSGKRRQEYSDSLGATSTHCSLRERAAVEAERASIKIAEVDFLKQHVGDLFEAVVSGVMPFGIFAELKRYGIEGLVRMRNLQDDYYVFDERSKSFKGRHTGNVYRLGDQIYVRVIRVDEIRSEIDMEMISEREFLDEGGERPLDQEPTDAKFSGGADGGDGMSRVGIRSSKRPGGAAPGETPKPSKKSKGGKATAGAKGRGGNAKKSHEPESPKGSGKHSRKGERKSRK